MAELAGRVVGRSIYLGGAELCGASGVSIESSPGTGGAHEARPVTVMRQGWLAGRA